MPAIYFSKRKRIKKIEQNKAVDEMKREKKPAELENTISMPSDTLFGDNEANNLAKKN